MPQKFPRPLARSTVSIKRKLYDRNSNRNDIIDFFGVFCSGSSLRCNLIAHNSERNKHYIFFALSFGSLFSRLPLFEFNLYVVFKFYWQSMFIRSIGILRWTEKRFAGFLFHFRAFTCACNEIPISKIKFADDDEDGERKNCSNSLIAFLCGGNSVVIYFMRFFFLLRWLDLDFVDWTDWDLQMEPRNPTTNKT